MSMTTFIGNSSAWALIGLGVLLSIAERSHATTITILNLDGAGEGFNDPGVPDPASSAGGNAGATLGAQRLIAFQFAADLWEGVLTSTVEIKVDANFNPLFCSVSRVTLGQAGPNTVHRDFAGAPVASTWYVQALANARSGTDRSLAQNDIGAQFNSTFGTTCAFPGGWYYGLDGNPPAGSFDFPTVVLHELAHGLGFLSLVDLGAGSKFVDFDDAYMRLLENHATGKLFPAMTNAERIAAHTSGSNLHWTGGEALICGNTALTSGRHPATGHIEMYAQVGSSVSHFSTSLGPNQLMEPFHTGPLLDLEALLDPCLLADLGWTIAPTPPPPPPVLCDGLPATIVGTDGRDRLLGTPGNDVIHGLAGDDVITGLGGNDVICGGPGRDQLSGNLGKDSLLGGAGKDVLKGGAGSDRLFGQNGNDAMDGQSGSDRCNGGSGNDTAAGCESTARVP